MYRIGLCVCFQITAAFPARVTSLILLDSVGPYQMQHYFHDIAPKRLGQYIAMREKVQQRRPRLFATKEEGKKLN